MAAKEQPWAKLDDWGSRFNPDIEFFAPGGRSIPLANYVQQFSSYEQKLHHDVRYVNDLPQPTPPQVVRPAAREYKREVHVRRDTLYTPRVDKSYYPSDWEKQEHGLKDLIRFEGGEPYEEERVSITEKLLNPYTPEELRAEERYRKYDEAMQYWRIENRVHHREASRNTEPNSNIVHAWQEMAKVIAPFAYAAADNVELAMALLLRFDRNALRGSLGLATPERLAADTPLGSEDFLDAIDNLKMILHSFAREGRTPPAWMLSRELVDTLATHANVFGHLPRLGSNPWHQVEWMVTAVSPGQHRHDDITDPALTRPSRLANFFERLPGDSYVARSKPFQREIEEGPRITRPIPAAKVVHNSSEPGL